MNILDFIRMLFSKDKNPSDYAKSARALYDTSYIKSSYGNTDSIIGWTQLRTLIENNNLLNIDAWS